MGNKVNNEKIKVMMVQKRRLHASAIDKHRAKNLPQSESLPPAEKKEIEEYSPEDIGAFFPRGPKSRKVSHAKKAVSHTKKDEEHYLSFYAKNHHTEAGYSAKEGFERQADGAVLDLTGDDSESIRKKSKLMKWDAKSKKYVKAGQDPKDKKKMKTESGTWIPASYKSNRYAKWKASSKINHLESDDKDSGGLPENHPALQKARNAMPKHRKGPKMEIKRPEQILKLRKEDDKKKFKNSKRSKKGNKKRKK